MPSELAAKKMKQGIIIQPFTYASLQVHRGTEPVEMMPIMVAPLYYTPDSIKDTLRHFKCRRCGECCTKTFVMLPDPEIYSISSFLKIRPRRVRRLLNKEGLLPPPCPFLKSKNICSIYQVRPSVCRTYPIIPYLCPEWDKELPVLAIMGCPGGQELIDWLVPILEKMAKLTSQNPELQRILIETLPMRRQNIKKEVIVIE